MPQWMTRGAGLDYFGNVVDVSLIPTRANDPQAANDATLASWDNSVDYKV